MPAWTLIRVNLASVIGIIPFGMNVTLRTSARRTATEAHLPKAA